MIEGERTAAYEPARLIATPFRWIEPAKIPPRQWLYGRHLIRGFLSATIATGGVGKSSLIIAETISMVVGRGLLGEWVKAPLRVWVWNGEDPLDEMQRRVAATCLQYGITDADLGGRLFLDVGRVTPIVLATENRNGVVIAEPVIAALRQTIAENKIDVVVIDPLVAAHAISENDNSKVNAVCRQLASIAEETGCAFELVHHIRKGNGGEVGVDDARGASALLAAVRSARTLNAMSADEAAGFGIEQRRDYFRVDNGKANLAPPPDKASWFRKVAVDLGNGGSSGFDFNGLGDQVAVVTSWEAPDAMASVTVHHLRETQRIVAGGEWREAVQSRERWVGAAVAQAMGLDWQNKAHRRTINAALGQWFASGMLVKVQRPDQHRELRGFVEVGEWATD